MEIGSRLYSVYQCSHCHYAETAGRDISDAWTRCEHCGARTVALERTELIDGGRYERRHYRCRNCGHDSHSDHRRQSDNDELLRGMLLGALLNSGRIEAAGVVVASAEAADLAEVASVEAPRVVVVPPVAGSLSSIPLRYELALRLAVSRRG